MKAQDLKMIENLKAFAKAINFVITSEEDVKVLLKKWVNHRGACNRNTKSSRRKLFIHFKNHGS